MSWSGVRLLLVLLIVHDVGLLLRGRRPVSWRFTSRLPTGGVYSQMLDLLHEAMVMGVLVLILFCA